MSDRLPAVLVVSDQEDLRSELSGHLAASGFAVGPAEPWESGPDLVVLASFAPASERIRAVQAAQIHHEGRPIVTTMPTGASGTQLRKALRAGASGIVLDGDRAAAMAPTALAVVAGQLAVPIALARRLAPSALSHREKEIVGLLVRGCTNRQIADTLFLAESTVKTHLSSIFGKLDARSRAEAVALVLDPEEGHGLGFVQTVTDIRKIDDDKDVE